jgi:hypothetical protein
MVRADRCARLLPDLNFVDAEDPGKFLQAFWRSMDDRFSLVANVYVACREDDSDGEAA